MKKYIKYLCIFLCLFASVSVGAADFGLVLDQNAGYENSSGFNYTGILIPRFSTLLGDSGRFNISAGINIQSNPWIVAPELLRTEFNWRFDSMELSAGRIPYSDPLGYIANGLFDGAIFSVDTQVGTFSAGAWYTGLLYKKRINITMTQDELLSHAVDLDYSDFYNSYFASRRALAAFGWEHPALKEFINLRVSILGQFDFTGSGLHSQYLAAKVTVPIRDFVFDLGGCVELIEDSGEFGIGLAGELGVAWMLPTRIEDRLSLLGRFSSGNFDDSAMCAFQPLTTNPQGDMLQTKLSGVSIISLAYLGRFHRTLSAGLSSSYYIGSDKSTNTIVGNEGFFWGLDFYGRLLWSPVSDIQLSLGSGIFLPALGNAAPGADPRWRVELGLVISLY